MKNETIIKTYAKFNELNKEQQTKVIESLRDMKRAFNLAQELNGEGKVNIKELLADIKRSENQSLDAINYIYKRKAKMTIEELTRIFALAEKPETIAEVLKALRELGVLSIKETK